MTSFMTGPVNELEKAGINMYIAKTTKILSQDTLKKNQEWRYKYNTGIFK